MSVGHTYMGDDFPPATVPSLPEDFDYHLLETDLASANDHEEDLENADSGEGSNSLADMDDRELMIFQEMYGFNGEEM